MSPTPDKSVKRATMHLGIDLPDDFEELAVDQQRTVRRAFKDAIARHPDETDDTAGAALRSLQRGQHALAPGVAWIDAELVAKSGYPSQAELRAFVSQRLASYNAAIRGPRGEGALRLTPEPSPSSSGATSGGSTTGTGSTGAASTGSTSTGAASSGATSGGTTSGGATSGGTAPPGGPNPTGGPGGPGGPRTIRYRIIDGELYCFYGYWVQVAASAGGGGSTAPDFRPYQLEVDAGQALTLPVYAEVGFTRDAGAT